MQLRWRVRIAWLAMPAAACWSSVATAECKIDPVAAMAVSMQSGVPVASGAIDGHPVRFLIASDAFSSAISPELAHQLGLSVQAVWGFDITAGGQKIPGYRAYAPHVKLSESWAGAVVFILAKRADALAATIGQDVLAEHDVEYDLAHGIIRSSYAIDCLDETPAYWAGEQTVRSLPLERERKVNKHTIATIVVNGVKLHASFDTTASQTSISLRAVKRLKASLADREATVDLDFGGERHRGVNLRVFDYGDSDVDMRIGLDFFLTHRVYVANDMRRIYFTYSGGPVFGVVPNAGSSARSN